MSLNKPIQEKIEEDFNQFSKAIEKAILEVELNYRIKVTYISFEYSDIFQQRLLRIRGTGQLETISTKIGSQKLIPENET